MKRGINLFVLGLFVAVFALSFFSAASDSSCNLNISLVNQDPYPAIPGDLLKLVFQVDGIDSINCGNIEISISEDFPFTFDPSSEQSYTIKSGTYNKNYKSYFQAPFKLRVNEEALDGENSIELKYSISNQQAGSYLTKQFQIEVKDVRADFEIFVKDYDSSTMTFQILNIGKEDISAVTMEIPKQEGVYISGANKNIVGDLDSNEDTTADFSLITNVSEINTIIYYTDSTGERRNISKNVSFDSGYFSSSSNNSSTSLWSYLIYLLIILAIVYFVYKKFFKKKKN